MHVSSTFCGNADFLFKAYVDYPSIYTHHLGTGDTKKGDWEEEGT